MFSLFKKNDRHKEIDFLGETKTINEARVKLARQARYDNGEVNNIIDNTENDVEINQIIVESRDDKYLAVHNFDLTQCKYNGAKYYK